MTYRFPNGWIGGAALVLGPALLLAGTLLRSPFDFFFPQQLQAAADHPGLMAAAYTTFLAGHLVMWPAVAVLVQRIGAQKPGWATWAGMLVTVGLFARTFHAGVDHAAFSAQKHRGSRKPRSWWVRGTRICTCSASCRSRS